MKRALLIASLLALGACGGANPEGSSAEYTSPRQQPSTYEPGLHVSGHVNVGVVRQF